jgi:hypothetical protein
VDGPFYIYSVCWKARNEGSAVLKHSSPAEHESQKYQDYQNHDDPIQQDALLSYAQK